MFSTTTPEYIGPWELSNKALSEKAFVDRRENRELDVDSECQVLTVSFTKTIYSQQFSVGLITLLIILVNLCCRAALNMRKSFTKYSF